MRLSCTPINQSDMEFLFRVYESVRADEMAMVPWTSEQKEAFVRAQFESQHHHYSTNYPDGKFLKIELEGEGIGRMYQCERADHFKIIDLSILPEFRGRGIGTKLLSDIVANSVKPVRIYLETFNKSIGLFERLGFRIIEGDGVYNLWEAPGKGTSAAAATV